VEAELDHDKTTRTSLTFARLQAANHHVNKRANASICAKPLLLFLPLCLPLPSALLGLLLPSPTDQLDPASPRHGSRRPRAGPPRRALLPPPRRWRRGRGGGGAGEVAGVRGGARAPRRRARRGGREDPEAARGQGLRGRHRARHRLQEGTEQRARIDGSGGRAVP